MSCDFDELFDQTQEEESLAANVNYRKVAEIERIIFDRVGPSGPHRGIVLRGVDIVEINFPEEIKQKINEEVITLLNARIKQTQTKAEELTARIKAQITQIEADARSTARVTEARGEETAIQIRSQAIIATAKANAQAKAEYFRQVIQVLRAAGQDETIKDVVQNLSRNLDYNRVESVYELPNYMARIDRE